MIQTDGRRFMRLPEPDFYDPFEGLDRIERAEAAERRERGRRIEAEAVAAELAQIVACEIAARQHAERIAAELQALANPREVMVPTPLN